VRGSELEPGPARSTHWLRTGPQQRLVKTGGWLVKLVDTGPLAVTGRTVSGVVGRRGRCGGGAGRWAGASRAARTGLQPEEVNEVLCLFSIVYGRKAEASVRQTPETRMNLQYHCFSGGSDVDLSS